MRADSMNLTKCNNHEPISSIVPTAGGDIYTSSYKCNVNVRMSMCVCTNLVEGKVNRPTEEDPLHYFTAGRRRERASVTVIASQRRRQ